MKSLKHIWKWTGIALGELIKWSVALIFVIGALLLAGFFAGLFYGLVRDGFTAALSLFNS